MKKMLQRTAAVLLSAAALCAGLPVISAAAVEESYIYYGFDRYDDSFEIKDQLRYEADKKLLTIFGDVKLPDDNSYIVLESHVSGLTINIEGDVSIYRPLGPALYLYGDTVITGSGSLSMNTDAAVTVNGEREMQYNIPYGAIDCQADMTLTLRNITYYGGVYGTPDANCALSVENSNVYAKRNYGASPFLRLKGGITLTDCAFVTPEEYTFNEEGTLLTPDGGMVEEIVISNEKTLTANNVQLSSAVLPYTGSKVKPGVTVTYGGKKLTAGTDYTLGYSSNVNAGYRTAKAVITGIGKYSGTVRVPFSIAPAQQAAPAIAFDGTNMTVSWNADANATGYKVTVSKSSTLNAAAKSTQTLTTTDTSATFSGMAEGETWYAAVTAYVTNEKAGIAGDIAKETLETPKEITKAVFATGAVEYEYTGKQVKPVMTVKCGSTVLTEGVDYTVTYKKNKAVGYKTATATVTGIGKYTGTITKKFTIVPAQQAAPAVKATKSGKLWVKWAEDANAIGYEVVISKSSTLNASAKSTVSTVFEPGTTSYSFGQPASGETWYVAVRAVISDDGTTAGTLYGSFSEIVKIKMP